MQTASSKIWTLIIDSIFCDGNFYAKHAFFMVDMYIYIYIYIYFFFT